jgi:hypothetical protein
MCVEAEFELTLSNDGQPGSYAGPQVCNRTNEISLTPQKSASGKLEISVGLAYFRGMTDRRPKTILL